MLWSIVLVPSIAATSLLSSQQDTCATDRILDLPSRAEARLVIPPPGEPGTPLVIEGRVVLADGRPVSGVLIYAYQANARGKYPKRPGLCGGARIQGYLRGYVQTDSLGRYEIVTIRPGAYEELDTPEHVHLTVATTRPPHPDRLAYIDDVMFEDDPILSPGWRARLEGRGGSGIVGTKRTRSDTLLVTRDIRWDLIPGVTAAEMRRVPELRDR